MVRELQILSTPVNVQCVPKVLPSHGGALNMPTWSTIAPRTGPIDLTWFCSLPEHEIFGMLFALVHTYTDSKLQLL
ncbi:hypothetical protein D3C74_456290 [compost metagenome]